MIFLFPREVLEDEESHPKKDCSWCCEPAQFFFAGAWYCSRCLPEAKEERLRDLDG